MFLFKLEFERPVSHLSSAGVRTEDGAEPPLPGRVPGEDTQSARGQNLLLAAFSIKYTNTRLETSNNCFIKTLLLCVEFAARE